MKKLFNKILTLLLSTSYGKQYISEVFFNTPVFEEKNQEKILDNLASMAKYMGWVVVIEEGTQDDLQGLIIGTEEYVDFFTGMLDEDEEESKVWH